MSTNYTATYSPDDNKLRLYASARLDAETYARVKEAGFRWAPKQELFVAPMWTPEREDLLLELAGEIEDEDKSLSERAEERSERFDEYSDARQRDADQAHAAVKAIADNIPLGQPILVGHHSERHARKDAERIQNGMRRAVKAWETSQYWAARAKGAIRAAKYKERADVRQRRIKGIEADKRKQERYKADAEKWLKLWSKEGLTLEQARAIANFCHLNVARKEGGAAWDWWSAYDVLQPDGERYQACPSMTVEQCQEAAKRAYPRTIAACERWITHYENRLTYERAMLDEQGGSADQRWKFEPGGRIKRRGEWLAVLKVNPQSVTVAGHWASTVSFDEISDYEAPTAERAAAAKAAAKIPPLCNYPGEGFKHLTAAELDACKERQWSDFGKTKTIPRTATVGAHRVQCCRGDRAFDRVGVYVTDKPRKDPPQLQPEAPDMAQLKRERDVTIAHRAPAESDADTAQRAEAFRGMEESLRAGVQVVSAPQLFPTPPEIAARMVDLAQIPAGARVLEPSAGTGRILEAMPGIVPFPLPTGRQTWCDVVAIEQNQSLAERLRASGLAQTVRCADFLECVDETGFDRIVMNPPFENCADIKHIRHAFAMLKPGGRLVALCANGPRQREAFAMAELWQPLPAGSFKDEGTAVNVALIVLSKRPAQQLTDDFALSPASRDELRAKEGARTLAALEEAKDRKRAAAPAPEGFVLSGSDRPADIAEANGQRRLL